MNKIIKKNIIEKSIKDIILVNSILSEWKENKCNSRCYFSDIWENFTYKELSEILGVSKDFLKNLNRNEPTPIPLNLFIKLKKIEENVNNIYL